MDAKQGTSTSSKRKKKADKLSAEEKKRRAALSRWTKKLGPIGGAGHYDGDEGWPGKGGDRHEMDRTGLKRVLRLLSLGAKEVNFKFQNSHNISVEECGWKLKYIRCEKDLETGEITGDGFHHIYLEKIGGGPKMKAHAVERWWYYDLGPESIGTERIKVVDNGQLYLKLKRRVRGAYITVDITILPEDSTESGEESPDTQPDSQAQEDGGCFIF
ncbi:unnamed protein product [Oikopleura dioica]|uniref:Uncharacterized protein n=1 Tax=Oikopleura dioica TaxID=34765 RepID=E4YS93_OIKDI|nr:unnamed protein product [Oikopleura dioica]